MKEFISWIIDNKEWLIPVVGVVASVVLGVGRIIFKKTQSSSTQTIHSGNSSTNVQTGRDVNIDMKKRGNDAD